jgi:hypothetical protein
MTSFRLACLAAVFALVGFGCGGGDDGDPVGPGPDGNETRWMRAKIDGVDWSVPELALGSAASHTSPGLYVIIAQPTGDHRLQIVLSNIAEAGVYPLGVGANVRGGTVTLSLAPSTWIAPPTGAAGSITLTALSDTLIAGTFSFEARPVGGAGGTKIVTDGEFRLPVTTVGVIGPPAENAWSEVRATVAGSAWNAAGVATTFSTSTLSIVAFTDTRTITMTIAEVAGEGDYPISTGAPIRSITVVGDGVDPLVCCWGPYAPATGSVTIESLTGTRIRGRFAASLEPAPGSAASGTLGIVSGTFDNGLLGQP